MTSSWFWMLLLLPLVNAQEEDPDCFCVDEINAVEGLSNLVVIVNAEDGSDRLFVAEQIGVIWLLSREGEGGEWTLQQEPFLNISVYYDNTVPGSEEGLLAVRFHPNYITTGYLYAWYSVYYSEEDRRFTRLSEFRVSSSNPNIADTEYERVILQVEQLEDNHNGGDLIFLDDGTLVIFTGDGGHQGDPFNNALNKMSALGKVLRIDIDNTQEEKEYAIPEDNPYIGDSEALPELYAIGLRNPWRAFKEQNRENSRVFLGDVGQNTIEEINLLQSGANYGWSAFEGSQCYKPELCPEYESAHTKPIYEYLHDDRCSSIIQGPMYTGTQNPGFTGWLFFADFMCGSIARLLDNGTSPTWTDMKRLNTCDPSTCEAAGLSDFFERWIVTWGEDEQGEVYFGAVAGDTLPIPDSKNGRVYKMVHRDSIPGIKHVKK